MGKTVLVVGDGGREHALTWKLAQSPLVSRIICAPGNAGTAKIVENIAVAPDDIPGLVALAKRERVDLTVVGPAPPLVLGLVDALETQGLLAFGPRAAGAAIEGSKAFCRQMLAACNIPGPHYALFMDEDEAANYIRAQAGPMVIKADGLAAGRGLVFAPGIPEALEALHYLHRVAEHQTLVIEEYLEGHELSVLAITDGDTLLTLPPVRDYRRAFDEGKGPNTAGMGSISPVPDVTDGLICEIEETIFRPLLKGLQRAGRPFKGVLYAGLMLTPLGPRVLNMNARFGDPETQVLMARMEDDLFPILWDTAAGKLAERTLRFDRRSAACVVLAAPGYPKDFPIGLPIHGLEGISSDVAVFHGGTSWQDGKLVNSGGRVLGVTALGETLTDARDKAYAEVDKIKMPGGFYRTDIGIEVCDL
jgi:phosphoribosylamine--glycine ligase